MHGKGTRGAKSPARATSTTLASSRTTFARAAPLLLLFAFLLVRGPVIRYPFFADDYLFLDQVRGHSVATVWSVPDPLRNYWRPLGRQGYFGLVSLLGESPAIAHALNLALLAGILALLYMLARRLAGARAAMVATGIVAIHEVADVPVVWASGSQDLLAVAGGLGALVLASLGRTSWAAVALLGGLLSKETVAATPVIALWMLRVPGETWRASLRRAAPLFVALAVWLPVWATRMLGANREGLRFGLESVPAAFAHLAQAFLGAQWGPGSRPGLAELIPILPPAAAVILAIALVIRREPAEIRPTAGDRGLSTGLVWAFLGAVPVAMVVHIWSSYYYLFAVCGLSLALAAAARRAPWGVTLASVLILALGSQHARRMETFATRPDPWGTQSHLSRFYFDRSMRWVSRYLEDLRNQLPSVSSHSTLYFAGIPAFASWQAGDGALLRWVYRDPTIRSYYFADFSLDRARRGDVLVFTARNDSLVLAQDPVQGLQLIASGQLLSEHFDVAEEAVARALDLEPSRAGLHYWLAWLRFARGDRSTFLQELAAAGCSARTGPAEEVATAKSRLAAGDADGALRALTEGVARHALDPAAHAELADLLLRTSPRSGGTAMEALAARLLAPADPASWRRWAYVQVANQHAVEAYGSLRRYFELAGPAGGGSAEDLRLLEQLRASLPGGTVAQDELRRRPRVR